MLSPAIWDLSRVQFLDYSLSHKAYSKTIVTVKQQEAPSIWSVYSCSLRDMLGQWTASGLCLPDLDGTAAVDLKVFSILLGRDSAGSRGGCPLLS